MPEKNAFAGSEQEGAAARSIQGERRRFQDRSETMKRGRRSEGKRRTSNQEKGRRGRKTPVEAESLRKRTVKEGREVPGGVRFVRVISHDPAAGDEQGIPLTVRGLYRGAYRMEGDDGTAFLCARENAKGALVGDEVLAERIGRESVVVLRVTRRAHEIIMGVLRVHGEESVILPLERRLPPEIPVEGKLEPAQDGDIVRTRVIRWEDEGGLCVCLEDRIGSFQQTTCALDALVMSQHLRTAFDREVLAQAEECRPARLEDDPEREDLRGILSFTIDGRDAKDFDDAVSLEVLENGHALLGVHIADVGHYVPQGTPLDREAYRRGTSVYLPGRVLPMLPEQLSNGVCSLRPQEDKFTLSALMEMDETGRVVRECLKRTITRSKARLVYDDVNAFFAGAQQETRQLGALGDTLLAMRALAEKLRARREAGGCIDFETEEPQFVLDEEGEPVEIVKRERGDAEKMIEDFMLAANESVARFARERHVPLLYRVHEKPDPDKLAVFADFLDGIGVNARRIRHHAAPGDIRAVLESTKDCPEYSAITTLALRSMQKARYDPKPLGHFGLAMGDYCHFTSPIRRYPDLVVSRAVTAALTGQRASLTGEALADAALRSSDCERTAVEAERAADKLMMARMMARHVGEIFSGKVSSVTEFGLYVELSNGAEGFVPVRTLDDWFDFDERRLTLRGERTGTVFSLGQELEVRVENVELTLCTIDLAMITPLSAGKSREKSPRKQERERMREFSR